MEAITSICSAESFPQMQGWLSRIGMGIVCSLLLEVIDDHRLEGLIPRYVYMYLGVMVTPT